MLHGGPACFPREHVQVTIEVTTGHSSMGDDLRWGYNNFRCRTPAANTELATHVSALYSFSPPPSPLDPLQVPYFAVWHGTCMCMWAAKGPHAGDPYLVSGKCSKPQICCRLQVSYGPSRLKRMCGTMAATEAQCVKALRQAMTLFKRTTDARRGADGLKYDEVLARLRRQIDVLEKLCDEHTTLSNRSDQPAFHPLNITLNFAPLPTQYPPTHPSPTGTRASRPVSSSNSARSYGCVWRTRCTQSAGAIPACMRDLRFWQYMRLLHVHA